MYEYHGTMLRVVDADTIDIDIDLGLRVHRHTRVKLLFPDAPEIYGVKKDSEEYAKGQKATEWVEQWFDARGGQVVLKTHKDKTGKFGRWLGEIFDLEGVSLNEELAKFLETL
jgi:micrococcal nuclease